MKILHFSHTPLVGAPGRICKALELKGVDARWVVLQANKYGGLSFDIDWSWNENREEVISFAKNADLFHLHNYIDLNCKEFLPIDFQAEWDNGRPIVRQFHSSPQFVAKYMGVLERDVMECKIPKLVIAQFQERFFPNARVVPNIVFPASYCIDRHGPLRVAYAPSNFRSAHISRWDSKGYPEVVKTIRSLMRDSVIRYNDVEFDIITQVSHSECMARKACSDVFIDDLVTGSYHLNTLEALASGNVALCHIDGRVKVTLDQLLGRNDFPVLDVPLGNLREVLVNFAENPNLARDIGKYSWEWMRKYWSPADMAQHFITTYKDVIANPSVKFSSRFDCDPVANYLRIGHYDQLWIGSRNHWPKLPPILVQQIRHMVSQALLKLRVKK